jgi:hypothetical protein
MRDRGMAIMRPAKLRGGRMIKVSLADRDLKQLIPHLHAFDFEDAAARWQCAAELPSAGIEFRNKIFEAIVSLLIGSIAASHRVCPHDRSKIANSLRRACKETQLVAEAYLLHGRNAPRELERALLMSIDRQLQAEAALGKIGQLQDGRQKYRALAKFVPLVGEAYKEACGKPPIVKLNTRSVGGPYSGPFAELLEAVRADAAAIWKSAGFKIDLLNGPRGRNTRLEYARKTMHASRAKKAKKGENPQA